MNDYVSRWAFAGSILYVLTSLHNEKEILKPSISFFLFLHQPPEPLVFFLICCDFSIQILINAC